MFVIVANRIARRQLRRSEPGGDDRRLAGVQLTLDRVTGDDRIVDEQARAR